MSANFIGPPKRNFDQLFRLAENELAALRVTHIDAALLVAMCVNASQANGYYCCSLKSYREALGTLMPLPKFNSVEFLGKVVPQTGFRKGQVPKFEFIRKNWHCAETTAWRCQGNETDGIILACNWGLAQLPAMKVCEKLEPQYKIQYLRAFLGDVNMQMRELIRILCEQDRTVPGLEFNAVFWHHVERVGCPLAEQKANRDVDLAAHLRTAGSDMSPEYMV